MRLRFHRELYAGTAIDQALGQLQRLATFERSEEPGYFVVDVRASSPARARKLGLELANFALGLTVERGGADR